MTLAQAIGYVLATLAAIGVVYQLTALFAFWRFFKRPALRSTSCGGVTILKPLHGAEPRLKDNLATFLEQRLENVNHLTPNPTILSLSKDWLFFRRLCVTHQEKNGPSTSSGRTDFGSDLERAALAQAWQGPVQMVCGVRDASNGAIGAVKALQQERREAAIDLAMDHPIIGSNAKIGNLAHMVSLARHDVLVLSDSDMAVGPDYLAAVLAALDQPGVGAVTCLYNGRADAGIWSSLDAAIISYSGAPKVTMSLFTGAAVPCMGSTIALRRETLEEIGGFERFADVLADDYAIGEAIRATGKSIAMPPILLTHACQVESFGELWLQHLRWAVTIRGVQPFLHVASGVVYAIPLSLLTVPFIPLPGLLLLSLALASRFAVMCCVDTIARRKTAPFWQVPVADCIDFAIYAASLAARTIHWRGSRLTMTSDGRI